MKTISSVGTLGTNLGGVFKGWKEGHVRVFCQSGINMNSHLGSILSMH